MTGRGAAWRPRRGVPSSARARARAGVVAVVAVVAAAAGCSYFNPDYDADAAGAATSATETGASATTEPGTTSTTGTTGTTDASTTETTAATTRGTTTDAVQSTGVVDDVLVLVASKIYAHEPPFFDGHVELGAARSFALPLELPVVEGNAGNHEAHFTYWLAGAGHTCVYRGGSDQSTPEPGAQWEKGLSYIQKDPDFCGTGKDAGDEVTADAVTLSVNNGVKGAPPEDPRTRVVVEIPLY